MNYSDQQSLIIEDGSKDKKVSSYAGTGKTHTLIGCAKVNPKAKKLYICFNKSVQQEGVKKFKNQGVENIDVVTAHSIAYRSISPKGELTFSVRVYDLLTLFKKPKTPTNFFLFKTGLSLFTYYCNSSYLVIEDIDLEKEVVPHLTMSEYSSLIKKQNGFIYDIAKGLWTAMESGKMAITHDFYLKKYQLSNPVLDYDIIYFDEGQDANPCMLDVFTKQSCSKVIIGDTHQAIYGWRGAVDALEKSDFKNFYLTESYRFHEGIANVANHILNKKIDLFGLPTIPPLVGLGKPFDSKNGSNAYLGRTNLSVLSHAIDLVESGRTTGFSYEGSINNSIYTADGVSVYDVYGLFSNQKKYIRSEFIKSFSSWKEFTSYVKESEEAELSILGNLVTKYKSSIFSLIKKLKQYEKPKGLEIDTIYSTAHKSKGLEYDNVFLLDGFLTNNILQSFTKQRRDSFNSLPQEVVSNIEGKVKEEFNLLYVACTRAKNNLALHNDFIT